MSEVLERDDAAARAAAADPRASILLEAPAGAGKTAVLTQRFLRLLCTVDDPGQILAITFTRKAAAEMHARVTRALRGELTGADAGSAQLRALAAAALAHGAERGWRLAEEPQGLRIQTIDAFNYWVASQLPIAAKAGGALEVTEAADALYHTAARSTLIAAEADPALAPDVQLLFERFDNHWTNIEAMLAQMLRERGHWLPYVLEQPAAELCARVNASLAAVLEAQLLGAVQLLPPALRSALQRLPGVGPLEAAAACLAHWKRLAFLTRTEKNWRSQLTAHRLGAEFHDAALRADCSRRTSRSCRGSPAPRSCWGRCRAGRPPRSPPRMPRRSRRCRGCSRARPRSCSRSSPARGASITPSSWGLRARRWPRRASRRTWRCAPGCRCGTSWSMSSRTPRSRSSSCWPRSPPAGRTGDGRTLFVVGDPMQSIYRFREAEVGLFLAARDAGIGQVPLTPLRLRRNFRSAPELVEFCNTLFAQVFPAADDLRAGAVAYHVSIAARPATAPLAAPVILLRLFPADRDAEAQAVAARIAALRAADPAGRIAILVAAHVHAAPVIAALGARGVPCLGVDLVPLRERIVVRDLVQLACALYDLADRNAWLAVLRAPWCGADLHTLTALSGPRETLLVFEALADARRLARVTPADLPRLARVRAVLAAALARRGRAPVADWLEATWVQLGAPDAYQPAELEDARVFFSALAERAAAFEWRQPADFPALLQRLFSPGLAADANPVQVMTIHRAKGLEFEHVLVPCLDRKPGGGERRLLRWIDLPNEAGASDLIISPAPAVSHEAEADLDRFLKGLLREREAHERTRLMYVAATRARETLWLSAAPPRGADGELKAPAHSLLACLWPVLQGRFALPAPASAAHTGAGPHEGLRRLGAQWSAPVLPAAAALPHLPVGQVALEPPEFSWVGETQRQVGTIVHGYLARIAAGALAPTAAGIAAEHPQVLQQLARHGVPAGERAQAAALILRALTQSVADERGRWILDPGHRDARGELALSGLSEGRLRTFVIDRTFIDAAGTRWVIDYKTSRHEGGGVEAFLDSEVARYRAQLAGYVALLSGLGPEPVRAGLYFPLLGAFREVEGLGP